MVTLKDQNQATIYTGNSTNAAGVNTFAMSLGTFTNPISLEITNSSSNQTFEIDNITLTQDGIEGVSYYTAQLVSAQDYYPFGTTLPGRTFQDDRFSGYRYGFNGQERDDEVSGAGNTMTAEFWMYDARLGRRWNVDPLTDEFPWQTPYSTFDNNPINLVDPTGESAGEPEKYKIKEGNTLSEIAKAKGTTVDEIMKLNPQIKDKNKIYTGQNLNLPPSPKSNNTTVSIPSIKPQEVPQTNPQTPIKSVEANFSLPIVATSIITQPATAFVVIPLFSGYFGYKIGENIEFYAAKMAEVLSIVIPAEYLQQTTVKAKEHTKNKQTKNWNKHTKPRSGRSNTKNRIKDNWKPNLNKK